MLIRNGEKSNTALAYTWIIIITYHYYVTKLESRKLSLYKRLDDNRNEIPFLPEYLSLEFFTQHHGKTI